MSKTPHVAKAMFVDEVDIFVFAGDGGNGCMAFRREKYTPRGGPSGGDGGHGASVFLRADDSLNTLQHLAGKHHWRAPRGGHGMGKDCHGRNGEDMYIPVPEGTLVYDDEHGILLKDLVHCGDCVCVATGGKGGRGNARFKSATHQAPRDWEPGSPGQERKLRLRLKLIADAGLLGMPNAGKSTLLSRLSAARPKIAAYPFTTLHPYLGIVELSGFRRFVLADIPGLIEGAHQGAGLGDEFLRHVERTRLLIHIIDLCPADRDPADDYHAIRRELSEYSETLAQTCEIVVANKMDLTDSEDHLRQFRQKVDADVIAISAATGQGLTELTEAVWKKLRELDEQEGSDT